MKAEMAHDGVITISAETDVEAYALGKFADQNLNGAGVLDTKGLIIDHKPPSKKQTTGFLKNESS